MRPAGARRVGLEICLAVGTAMRLFAGACTPTMPSRPRVGVAQRCTLRFADRSIRVPSRMNPSVVQLGRPSRVAITCSVAGTGSKFVGTVFPRDMGDGDHGNDVMELQVRWIPFPLVLGVRRAEI